VKTLTHTPCPRCKGTLVDCDRDLDGGIARCLMCGHRIHDPAELEKMLHNDGHDERARPVVVSGEGR